MSKVVDALKLPGPPVKSRILGLQFENGLGIVVESFDPGLASAHNTTQLVAALPDGRFVAVSPFDEPSKQFDSVFEQADSIQHIRRLIGEAQQSADISTAEWLDAVATLLDLGYDREAALRRVAGLLDTVPDRYRPDVATCVERHFHGIISPGGEWFNGTLRRGDAAYMRQSDVGTDPEVFISVVQPAGLQPDGEVSKTFFYMRFLGGSQCLWSRPSEAESESTEPPDPAEFSPIFFDSDLLPRGIPGFAAHNVQRVLTDPEMNSTSEDVGHFIAALQRVMASFQDEQ